MSLIAKVRRFIGRQGLASPETRVVAALSGGPDSVALVHILRDLQLARVLRLVGVVHVHHGLRPTADHDQTFCEALARSLELPAHVERADVAGRARRERRSIEDAAHLERYACFERARIGLGADVVALGHTRDDQAETVLLRLLRGAGARGLAGMYPRIGAIVRPLLDCRRAELVAYLADHQLASITDETNGDVTIPRNRVRAELLPLLQDRFNPSIVEVLADEATLARESWDWMRQTLDDAYARVVVAGEDTAIDLRALEAEPRSLKRLILWRALTESSGGKPIAFAHVDRALELVEGGRDGRIDVPGRRLERIGAIVVLRERAPRPSGEGPANLFRYPLSIPGEVVLAETGCAVAVEPVTASDGSCATAGNGAEAHVRRDLVTSCLAVRNRLPGDRFRPVGLGGSKKLQDFFVDRKVARQRRDSVPLVVDERDRIVWVAGYGIDEGFRVTDPAQGVLLLRLRQL